MSISLYDIYAYRYISYIVLFVCIERERETKGESLIEIFQFFSVTLKIIIIIKSYTDCLCSI